jgi:hypothetical protein
MLLCAALDAAALAPAPAHEALAPAPLAASVQPMAIVAPKLVGTWTGRWIALGYSGGIGVKVTKQVGNKLTCSITARGTTIKGTFTAKFTSGGGFSFTASDSHGSIALKGKVVGKYMSGTFKSSGSIGTASGTFTATHK